MKASKLFVLAMIAFSPFARAAEEEIEIPIITPIFKELGRLFDGPYEQVVCMSEGNLNVRSDNLRQVLFMVPNHEPVKVFQGWGDTTKSKVIGGQEYTFVKVQFTRREQRGQKSVGWVADQLIRPRSQCEGASGGPREEPEQIEEEQKPTKPVKPITQPVKPVKPITQPVKPTKPSEEPFVSPGSNEQIRGLNDPNCCEFPTKGEVTTDFNDGMRRFGARRSGGRRLHAACDLYRHTNEPISSVAPGTILRNRYPFYEGTYALEVRHSGGFIVRYGEVTGKAAPNASAGSKIKMGQVIAYMGKVNSGCCEPMLHFELFSGSQNGSLGGSGPYQRRSDLLNPTQYLRKWEAAKFKSRK